MEKYENSELYLFKAMVLEECGQQAEALEYIDKVKTKIVDKLGMLEMQGRLYVATNRQG